MWWSSAAVSPACPPPTTPPARAPDVVLVEKDKIGSGASGRNGSMCTQGITIGAGEARKRYGQERARELYDAFREAVDVVEELTHEGEHRLRLQPRPGGSAWRTSPSTSSGMRAKQRDLAENFGHETTLLSKSELRAELGSDYYHGALLDPLSAGLHVGKYVHGLADAAERAGAEIHERNAATGLTRLPGGSFLVETLHGTIRAKQVMAATDAYTDKSLPWFRKRLINVGSFIIVTEPLGEDAPGSSSPTAACVVDSKNIGHYIRLTPDNRLAFGGRARFAPSNPASDLKSGDVLKREMAEIFPQLADVRIDYVWGGMRRLLLRPHPARGRGRRPVLLHGLLRPRRPDGHVHGPRDGRGDGRPPGGQPAARPRLPEGPGPLLQRHGLVPAVRRRLLQGQGPAALRIRFRRR